MTATRLSYYLDQDLLDNPPIPAHDGEECDYCEPPEPVPAKPQSGNLYGSGTVKNALWGTWETHLPVIDIDFPCRWVESSTPGHGHLYIDKELTDHQYDLLLRVLHEVGLVQDGIINQYDRLGQTFVRQPHVKKPAALPEIKSTMDGHPRNILAERVERPNPWPWLERDHIPGRDFDQDLGYLSWDVHPAGTKDAEVLVGIDGLPEEPKIDYDSLADQMLRAYLPKIENSIFNPGVLQTSAIAPWPAPPKRKPLRKRLWQKITDKWADLRPCGCGCQCEDW